MGYYNSSVKGLSSQNNWINTPINSASEEYIGHIEYKKTIGNLGIYTTLENSEKDDNIPLNRVHKTEPTARDSTNPKNSNLKALLITLHISFTDLFIFTDIKIHEDNIDKIIIGIATHH
ncbi:TPA: hypothetical protein ENS27_06265 [bacterium]|nr:hypothetical protein [bacterium]